MTAIATRGLVNSLAEIFEPIDGDVVQSLIAEYGDVRAQMDRLADIFDDHRTRAALSYFLSGNASDSHYTSMAVAERLFERDPAIAALNASYWDRLLRATDILALMPQARRDDWHKTIESRKAPDFDEATIRATLGDLLAQRHYFFAERVEGIFNALSRAHVTNAPEGFRKRMILDYVVDDWGTANYSRAGIIADLRDVVARFMGRTVDPGLHQLTQRLIRDARERHGEWIDVDGGALRIRVYKKGTAHLEVHPEIAARLNAILAHLHPGAIPESHRTRPTQRNGKTSTRKAPTTPLLFLRPLPFATLKAIADLDPRRLDGQGTKWTPRHGWSDLDKRVREDVERVLAGLGAVAVRKGGRLEHFAFDFDATEVVGEVLASGSLPDQRAHQYYPTPRSLAERVVALAEIGPDDMVLEPSAGQGHLADLLPKDRTVCVEVSALHCAVLRAKGFDVTQGDFLDEVPARGLGLGPRGFDRVVMNPPFTGGQWRTHVEHAGKMLAPGGRLVAVLPASAPHQFDLPGFDMTWSESIVDAFEGTGVSVVILTADKQA